MMTMMTTTTIIIIIIIVVVVLPSCRKFRPISFAVNGRQMKLNSVEEAFSYRAGKTITTCYKIYKTDSCYNQALSWLSNVGDA